MEILNQVMAVLQFATLKEVGSVQEVPQQLQTSALKFVEMELTFLCILVTTETQFQVMDVALLVKLKLGIHAILEITMLQTCAFRHVEMELL